LIFFFLLLCYNPHNNQATLNEGLEALAKLGMALHLARSFVLPEQFGPDLLDLDNKMTSASTG
jgi:hypothetical protein